MDRIVLDWEFDPSECKFEPGAIEIGPEVQELQMLDVKHYLSRHLQGDVGYISASDHTFYTETVERVEKGENDRWENPHSEYVIAPDKVLSFITYIKPPDGPRTIIDIVGIDPQNWKALNIEELYITVMAILNRLPPKEKEEFIQSANQKIPG